MEIFKKFCRKFKVHRKKDGSPAPPGPPQPSSTSNASPAPLTKKTISWVWARTQSFSWPTTTMTAGGETPKRPKRLETLKGCFTVYVGAEKERFLVKTEHASHPLFKALLDAAESEYGFNSDGPISLPCNVDEFNGVLDAIDYENTGGGGEKEMIGGCFSPLALYSPARRSFHSPARQSFDSISGRSNRLLLGSPGMMRVKR